MRSKRDARGLVAEMVNYYRKDPNSRRAVIENDTCVYFSENGKKCAIGRGIIPEKYDPEFEDRDVISLFENYPNFEENLIERFRGYTPEFLAILQRLHDVSSFWGNRNLTISGRNQLKIIKEYIDETFI